MQTERSVGALVSQVRYGVVYAELNEAIWSHLDTCLNVVQVLFGALAVAGLFGDPTLAKVAGGILAVVSGLQVGLGPLKRAIGYRDARIKFHELLGRAWKLQLEELEVQLEQARAAAPPGLRALSRPAWNMVAESLGSAEQYELTRVEAVAQALAW